MENHKQSGDEKPYICWFDCETTGLDPSRNYMLEFTFGFSNWETPFDVNTWNSHVISTPALETMWDDGLTGMEHGLYDAHVSSGLVKAVTMSRTSILQAQMAMMTKLDELPLDRKVMLAGNSIHFDRGFIKQWMPLVDRRLWHRMLDISAVSTFMQLLGHPKAPRPEKPAHRSEADIKQAVDQARFYAELAKSFGFVSPDNDDIVDTICGR